MKYVSKIVIFALILLIVALPGIHCLHCLHSHDVSASPVANQTACLSQNAEGNENFCDICLFFGVLAFALCWESILFLLHHFVLTVLSSFVIYRNPFIAFSLSRAPPALNPF